MLSQSMLLLCLGLGLGLGLPEKTLHTHQDINTLSRHVEARGETRLQCSTFQLRSGKWSEIVNIRSADRSAMFLLKSKLFFFRNVIFDEKVTILMPQKAVILIELAF